MSDEVRPARTTQPFSVAHSYCHVKTPNTKLDLLEYKKNTENKITVETPVRNIALWSFHLQHSFWEKDNSSKIYLT